MGGKDYYAALGVSRTADADEVKRAYRKLALKYHPDRNEGDASAEARFKEVNEAYAVLSDPDKRAQYDRFGAEGFGARFSEEDIFQNVDFGKIFEDLGFGGFDLGQLFGGRGRRGRRGGGRPPRGRAPRGEDVESSLTVGLHEALKGSERTLTVNGPGGSETITVKIPRGITTGKKLRVRGRGRPGPTGERGDLLLKVQVAEHPVYRLRGHDIEMDLVVPLTTAALGGAVDLKAPGGATRSLKIPPGTSCGRRIRVRGHGFPVAGGEPGDLYVKVMAAVPGELTDTARAHLEALRDEGL